MKLKGDSSSRDLGNLVYPLIVVTPRPSLTRCVSTSWGTIYGPNRSILNLFIFNQTVYKKRNESKEIIFTRNCVQIELLAFDSNTGNNLTVCKQ